MSLAVLYEYPENPDHFSIWSFVNMAHHRDIIRVIFEQTGEQLAEYYLDPVDPNSLNTWLYQHQVMHDQQNAVLGIAGWNLLELDLSSKDAANDWIQQHAQEHFAAGQILNIG